MKIQASEPVSLPRVQVAIPVSIEARSLSHFEGAGDGTPLVSPAMVCVLVPTRNEAVNVVPLLDRLDPVLAGMGGEVLFVDDSDDQTPAVVAAAAKNSVVPVRLLHRDCGERLGGLVGAVQEGLAAVTAPWTVVMDGDLQHPPEQLPDLITAGERGVDLVVATRYHADGSAAGLSSRFRGLASRGASGVARLLFPRALAGVSDPMSGFFAVRTAAVDPSELRPQGFKVLLEVLVRNPGLRVAEVPFIFADRVGGESKASGREAVRYLRQLAGLRMTVPSRVGRLLRFAMVGGSGVLVNLLVLALLLRAHLGALWAGRQAVAAIVATPGGHRVEFRSHRALGIPRPAGALGRAAVPVLGLELRRAAGPTAARRPSAIASGRLLPAGNCRGPGHSYPRPLCRL
jgi:glycosyltransferase involved in cell wall biosynthesis